jgi:hypothetical protein
MGRNPAVSTEPVLGALSGYKAARLVSDDAGPVSFSGVGLGGRYGPIDLAVCVSDRRHVAPAAGCGCGFYAWKERDAAAGLLDDERVALLEVELWGAFHEFEHGYIAAAQRVRHITLIPYCIRCLRRRRQLTRGAVGLAVQPVRDGHRLLPVCAEHAEDAVRILHRGELSEALGVEPVWAAERDTVSQTVPARLARPRPLLPRHVRRLGELVPGEVGYVFANSIAQDDDGRLYLDPSARLIQPLPGTDVPVWLDPTGRHTLGLDTLTVVPRWRPRTDRQRFRLLAAARDNVAAHARPCATAGRSGQSDDDARDAQQRDAA